jgi:hypothetical protein
VVTSTTPSELTLLHELAHFIGGMDHGPRFQEVYVRLVKRYISAEGNDPSLSQRQDNASLDHDETSARTTHV